jgi:hypothetical protein
MSAKIYDPAFRDHDVVRRLAVGDEVRSKEALRVARALQTAILNSVNFSSIATDATARTVTAALLGAPSTRTTMTPSAICVASIGK